MAKVLKEQQGKVLIYNNKAFKYPEELQSVIDSIIDRSVTSIESSATSIGSSAFYYCEKLTSISFPNATSISSSAFGVCSSLQSVSFLNVTSIGNSAFTNCTKLTSASFPNAISIGNSAFYHCPKLKSIVIPKVTDINDRAFEGCNSCLLFDFRGATVVPKLSHASAFNYTPSNKKIVVPDALYDEWITGTNWSDTRNDIVTSIIKASEYEASL